MREKDGETDGINRFALDTMAISVHPDLLREAIVAQANLSPEDRGDLDAQFIAIIKVVEAATGLKGRERTKIIQAISWRLQALDRLHTLPEFRGYATEEAPDGSLFIRDELVAAAASAPLVQRDQYTIEFDKDSLFQTLLRDGRHDGEA